MRRRSAVVLIGAAHQGGRCIGADFPAVVQQGLVRYQNDQAFVPGAQGGRQIKGRVAVAGGEQVAEVAVPGPILDQAEEPLLFRAHLGADDRGKPFLVAGAEKGPEAVEVVAVGQGQGNVAQLPGPAAEGAGAGCGLHQREMGMEAEADHGGYCIRRLRCC